MTRGTRNTRARAIRITTNNSNFRCFGEFKHVVSAGLQGAPLAPAATMVASAVLHWCNVEVAPVTNHPLEDGRVIAIANATRNHPRIVHLATPTRPRA